MKIKIIGNSNTWFSRPNTNFVIDDKIIFDTPQSCTKFMWDNVDFSKIKLVIISHFHSDHFADLHIMLDICKKHNKSMTVIGPKNLFKKLKTLFKIFEHDYSKKYISKFLNIIEVKPNQTIKFENYQIDVFKMKHSCSPALGYRLQKTDCSKTVGFTGDTCWCDGLLELVKKSDVVFADSSSLKKNVSHLCVEEILQLKKMFPQKPIYSVHVTDEILNSFNTKLNIPACQEVVNIE